MQTPMTSIDAASILQWSPQELVPPAYTHAVITARRAPKRFLIGRAASQQAVPPYERSFASDCDLTGLDLTMLFGYCVQHHSAQIKFPCQQFVLVTLGPQWFDLREPDRVYATELDLALRVAQMMRAVWGHAVVVDGITTISQIHPMLEKFMCHVIRFVFESHRGNLDAVCPAPVLLGDTATPDSAPFVHLRAQLLAHAHHRAEYFYLARHFQRENDRYLLPQVHDAPSFVAEYRNVERCRTYVDAFSGARVITFRRPGEPTQCFACSIFNGEWTCPAHSTPVPLMQEYTAPPPSSTFLPPSAPTSESGGK